MAGMFIIGAKVFNGIAAGTIIVVACAVARIGDGPVRGPRAPRPAHRPRADPVAAAPPNRFLRLAILARGCRSRPAAARTLVRAVGGSLIALAIPASGSTSACPATSRSPRQDDPALAALAAPALRLSGTSSPALVTVTGRRRPRRPFSGSFANCSSSCEPAGSHTAVHGQRQLRRQGGDARAPAQRRRRRRGEPRRRREAPLRPRPGDARNDSGRGDGVTGSTPRTSTSRQT
jgi:hypothetical protein